MDEDIEVTPLSPLRPRAPRGARFSPRAGTRGLPAGGGGGARNSALGGFGEQRAAEMLEADGLQVVDRNWRCELGELDIVALLPGPGGRGRPQQVVACEVKTRSSTRFGSPASQVTATKAARLRTLAHRWLREHPALAGVPVRVDVVGILVPAVGAPVVQHLRGVA